MKIAESQVVSLPLPSIAKKCVMNIEALELKRLSFEDVLKITWEAFPFLPVSVGKFESPLKLYRARISNDILPFSQVKDLSAPPVDLIKEFGRANLPGQRLFYAAFDPRIALLEVIPGQGNSPLCLDGYVTISIWELVSPKVFNLAIIWSAPQILTNRPDLKKIGSEFFDPAFDKSLFKFDIHQDKAITSKLTIDQHIANVFAKPAGRNSENHKLTTAYASRIICVDTEGAIDGIIYPSVAAQHSQDNVVLRESAFEHKIKITGGHFLKYHWDPSYKKLSWDQVAYAKFDGSKLDWT